MNLPNKLTVMRICLVPVLVLILLLPVNMATNIIGAFVFLVTAITDLLQPPYLQDWLMVKPLAMDWMKWIK